MVLMPWERELLARRQDRALELAVRANALLDAARLTGDEAALNTAIALFRRANGTIPTGHPGQAAVSHSLGNALQTRFGWHGQGRDLQEAVDLHTGAVAATAHDDPARPVALASLGAALQTRFERIGDLADLDASIDLQREAVAAATDPDHASARSRRPAVLPDTAILWSNLGNALRLRFTWTGREDDLDAALGAGWTSLAEPASRTTDHARHLSNLGNTLATLFEARGRAANLDEAITCFRDAVAAVSADHPDAAGYLANLCGALWTRARHTGRQTDLNEALEQGRRAKAAIPPDHPARPRILADLNGALQTHFEWTGSDTDLDDAVAVSRDAVAAAPPGHPDRAGHLSNLGIALQRRFEHRGDPADLDESVDLLREAVAATPDGHLKATPHLANLANLLRRRFELTGGREDLDAAVGLLRRAVASSSEGSSGHAGLLLNLSIAEQVRIASQGRDGDLAGLDQAIALVRTALAVTPPDRPDHARLQSTLGLALRARFEWTGRQTDVAEAIGALETAVAATPSTHPARASYLFNLGCALQTRFERTGLATDLEQAVAAMETAAAASPAQGADRGRILSGLGLVLQHHAQQSGDRAQLERSIEALRSAAAATPRTGPEAAGVLSNLSISLWRRSVWDEDGNADLDEAAAAGRAAVDAVVTDHPLHARYLSNLSNLLQTRFERCGAPADLDDAIDHCRAALAATPTDHPDTARYLASLGLALGLRYARMKQPDDLDAAVGAGRRAAAVEAASPRVRAHAARGWAMTAAAAGRWAEAADGFTAAIDLLGQVAPRGLARGDQEGLLDEQADLGSDAAACCVRVGHPARAVELLEQGRGVLLAQALDSRTDLGALREIDPALAERFAQLCARLDRPGPLDAGFANIAGALGGAMGLPGAGAGVDSGAGAGAGGMAGSAAGADPTLRLDRVDAEERRQAGLALTRTIEEIRVLPGFDSFLRPPTLADLRTAASAGPVILPVVSSFGSYALIVTERGLLDPVELPDLTPDAVRDRIIAFLTALDDPQDQEGHKRLAETLGWLWDALAGPVLQRLDALGFLALTPAASPAWKRLRTKWQPEATGPERSAGHAASAGRPRLWWCASGMLAFLPLHAAGHHETRHRGAPHTVLDHAISSFTPTLRALIHARRPVPAHPPATGAPAVTTDARATGTPVTPVAPVASGPPAASRRIVAVGMPRTPGAGDLPGAEKEIHRLETLFPGQVRTLIAHEATHAAVAAALPHAHWAHFSCHGYADLRNPSNSRLLLTDHERDPFTVVDVARLRLDTAVLAFLSACETGRPGGPADEGIHLASAFQLAGFRQVIATLWPVSDSAAAELAEELYDALALAPPDSLDVAAALHEVTLGLRGVWADQPEVWASHIHSGA
ncbi:CHAT domain-containing protein [Frankia sp. EAN1pec]|uniref:CHAT domain-containing protein n=1 Tax=Parafrankia sp. (strain EAN1pec) TaxID=298653 RepID=UPI00030F48B6